MEAGNKINRRKHTHPLPADRLNLNTAFFLTLLNDMIKPYAKVLIIIFTAAFSLLLPSSSSSGELGTDFIIDLWKYRTGEADSGLLTGRPSRKMPDAPPVAYASISGSIDCREHLVLHSNDIIDVALLDFAARDAAAVITGQKITFPEQIPIPFKLTYDPARINPAHHYTVQARIMRNGEPAFINSEPCFVITHGYSNTARVFVEQANTTQPSRAEK
jgi:putative lipoprotein